MIFKSKEFLKLKQEWEKKLKESGFKDAESLDKRTGEPRLTQWDSHYFHARNHPDEFEIKQEYYYMAHQFLYSNKWKSKTDRQVWKLHTEGLGVRQIADKLIKQGVRTNKDYVAEIIIRLKQQMKEVPKKCKKKILLQLDFWQMAT